MDGEAVWRQSLEQPLEAPRKTKKNFCQDCSLGVKPMYRYHFEDIQTDERNKHYNCKSISPVLVCATCYTHFILWDLINTTILCKVYKL
jgi:hypothetical protein